MCLCVTSHKLPPSLFPHHISPMSKSKKSSRKWWRKHFVDYPGFTNKDDKAFVASGSGATRVSKIYCTLCLVADIDWILKDDICAVEQGRIVVIRSEAAIEDYRELIS